MSTELRYHIPEVEPRHHMTYFELDPGEYAGLMQTVNEATHRSYVSMLQDHVRLQHGECLLVVGSDGKHERHAQSRTEFELILPKPDDGHLRDTLMQVLLRNRRHIHLELGPKQRVEVKVITDETPASYAFGDPARIYPDRLLNSTLILGSPATHRAIRQKILQELTNPQGRRIREKVKDQLSEYRRAIKTGIFRGHVNFDPTTGTQYYNETNPILTGFKPAFIRAIQRKFDLLTTQALQYGLLDSSDVLDNLSPVTIEKFNFFASRGLIDSTMAAYGEQSFSWFLQQYHHVQEHYKDAQRPIQLTSPRHVYVYHTNVILRFLESTGIAKNKPQEA